MGSCASKQEPEDEPSSEKKIIVAAPSGNTLGFKVRPTITVKDIKKKILTKEQIPIHLQRIFFGKKQLYDFETFWSYHLPEDANLQLKVRNDGTQKVKVKVFDLAALITEEKGFAKKPPELILKGKSLKFDQKFSELNLDTNDVIDFQIVN
ncbi:MAG: hypothetical protein EZS28_009621 [Streblomastix strix]|uniref:Ubiquitin-like domain-containing protein n=2 Tax=Streblomastix strix TaxID=222440 RepID=A0A5J4WK07_9EUKA|nr:MAG: hypothetical protein EZS28_009621 [Streblomastix strix]